MTSRCEPSAVHLTPIHSLLETLHRDNQPGQLRRRPCEVPGRIVCEGERSVRNSHAVAFGMLPLAPRLRCDWGISLHLGDGPRSSFEEYGDMARQMISSAPLNSNAGSPHALIQQRFPDTPLST